MSEQQRQGAERDLYRDTWVRYLGERGSERRSDPTTLGNSSRGMRIWSLKEKVGQEIGLRTGPGTCPRSHSTLSAGLCWRHKPKRGLPSAVMKH